MELLLEKNMQAKLIQIGNSQGVRLPKSVIRQYDFVENLELELRDNELVIKKSDLEVRKGWAQKFVDDNDEEKIEYTENSFDKTDWEWS